MHDEHRFRQTALYFAVRSRLKLAPSILGARLREHVHTTEKAGADRIHMDVPSMQSGCRSHDATPAGRPSCGQLSGADHSAPSRIQEMRAPSPLEKVLLPPRVPELPAYGPDRRRAAK